MPHNGYHGNPAKAEPLTRPRQPQPGQAPPPGLTVPPLPVIEAEHARLVERNGEALRELQLAGVELDPFALTHARIDHLIDAIAQFAGEDGPKWAAWTRLKFEQVMAENIATAKSEGRKQVLAQGAHWTPSMIRSLARESGFLTGR
jgi:hypothetical protein